jgi:signal transduction histidine kinase
MREISARAMGVFADLVRTRGFDVGDLREGSVADWDSRLRRRERMDWDLCCRLAERTEELLGGQQELDAAFAASLPRGASLRYFRQIVGLCVGVHQLYWITDHWFGPSLFPNVKSSQSQRADGRIEQRLEIPKPYRACSSFLRINAAALRAAPLVLGLDEAQIEAEITDRTAVILITPPPQVTVWSGLARLWRVLSGTRTALDELGEQQEQVTLSFAELRLARDRIAAQARQLQTINDIGRELAERVELDELGRTVASMLRTRVGLDAVALWVADRPGTTPRLLEMQGQRQGPPSRSRELVTGGTPVGSIEVWGTPAQLHPDAPSLLDELVPWIAIALHNALAFAELGRARDTLEERVIARTADLRETTGKLEVALRERERIDAERTQFFANASHELRTPLSLLLPVLEDLQTASDLSADQRTAVDHALRSGYRMVRLVNDLLDLSKIEAGALRLYPTPVDLSALLRHALEPWQASLARRGVGVELALPAELVLELDAERLESAAWNLLANASRFVPDGGRLAIVLTESAHRIEWAVSNSGPRIPEQELDRIFERFGQASDSPMRRYGTTGLGLAMVKEIALLHGGGVAAENLPGGGVRFRVWLPAQARQSAPAPKRLASASSAELGRLFSPELVPTRVERVAPLATEHGPLTAAVGPSATAATDVAGQHADGSGTCRPRLLIVEDHADLRAELCRTLGRDYLVLEAGDGLEGLRLCRSERPDLVLADVMMPELDGLGLVRELAADPATSSIPVVLLTARSDLGMKVRSLESGAHDYVVKPFHLEELRARLRVQLRLRDLGVELAERERLALLGTLVAGVAHELRNPLNGIINTVLPAREMLAGTSPELEALLDLAAVSARRVEQLSQRLLLMARAGEGPHVRIDALETVQLAARMVRGPRGAGPNIEVAPVGGAPLPALRGDAGAVMHVWVNLLDNAVRAAGPDGHVRVTLLAESEHVVVEVCDDGPGVPPEVADRIFEPFFTTRAAGQGTGLGLALAYKTVRQHGGTIELVPAAGSGACFRVRLPSDKLVQQSAAAAAEQDAQAAPTAQPRPTHAER